MRFASAGRRFSFGDGSAATGDAHAEQGSVEMEADRGRDRTDGRVQRAEMTCRIVVDLVFLLIIVERTCAGELAIGSCSRSE